MYRYRMAKPPIEYRPRFNALKCSDPITREDVMAQISPQNMALLEAYKAAERAKVLARVKKHRARQKAAKT